MNSAIWPSIPQECGTECGTTRFPLPSKVCFVGHETNAVKNLKVYECKVYLGAYAFVIITYIEYEIDTRYVFFFNNSQCNGKSGRIEKRALPDSGTAQATVILVTINHPRQSVLTRISRILNNRIWHAWFDDLTTNCLTNNKL